MFSASFLLASLVWSSVGLGYFIYGKKQASWVPTVGGLVMIAISYLIWSALIMSLVSIGIMVLVWVFLRQGF